MLGLGGGTRGDYCRHTYIRRFHFFPTSGANTNTCLSSVFLSLFFFFPPLPLQKARNTFSHFSCRRQTNEPRRHRQPPLRRAPLPDKRSRIFSSGRFQEEEAANARDSELSFARAANGSSNGSIHGSLGSSGSSSEVLERVGSSRCGPRMRTPTSQQESTHTRFARDGVGCRGVRRGGGGEGGCFRELHMSVVMSQKAREYVRDRAKSGTAAEGHGGRRFDTLAHARVRRGHLHPCPHRVENVGDRESIPPSPARALCPRYSCKSQVTRRLGREQSSCLCRTRLARARRRLKSFTPFVCRCFALPSSCRSFSRGTPWMPLSLSIFLKKTCLHDATRRDASSQISDGEPWGWFDEMEEVGGDGVGGAPAATPVVKATPPYILTVRSRGPSCLS